MIKTVGRAFIPKKYRLLIYDQLDKFIPVAKRVYRPLAYRGNQIFCLCCQKQFRKFLPYGSNHRPDAMCPGCGSLERHRLLWLYLQKKTNLFSDNLSVLHCAPEYIFQRVFETMANLTYITVDLVSRLARVRMDLTSISYKNNSFDVILCNHVLEHVPDDQKTMRELTRILKPDGWAIILSPIDPSLAQTFEDPSIVSPEARERAYGRRDHVRLYGRDYKDRLEAAGFKVKVDNYLEQLPAEMIKRYGLKAHVVDVDENIYLCTRA